jgi:hypothetical protein
LADRIESESQMQAIAALHFKLSDTSRHHSTAGHSRLAATLLTLLVACLVCTRGGSAAELALAPSPASPYAKWERGPSHDTGFFPIAVWLQDPRNASQYRAAGFNTYVGLWKGPTESQLASLKAAGMKLICDQNAIARAHLDDPTIIGWMHGDEPDNAQSLGESKGYGPPIPAKTIVADYEKIRAADPSRPVMLNLGQGVAWDGWHGRGVRTNHPEDYPEYLPGCDIVSFDIYPAAHSSPQVVSNLWYVPRGVERLVKWAGGQKVVWNCIECTRIQNKSKATPSQVRSEVWMSLIHGSMGLTYFVHKWQPKFDEAALLHDAEMLREVTAINRQITELAPVLNSPTVNDAVQVSSSNPELPVAVMLKRHEGASYLFAVAMRSGETTARFTLKGLAGEKTVEVLGEDRNLNARSGAFSDTFKPWAVHCYRIK